MTEATKDSMAPNLKQRLLARNLYLGDAAYLQDELSKSGIEAEIVKNKKIKGKKKPNYNVYVGGNEYGEAKAVMNRVLTEENSSDAVEATEHERVPTGDHRRVNTKKRWIAALTAGVLGLMTGARVGIKMHNRNLHIVFTLGLGLIMFFLVFRAYGKKNS